MADATDNRRLALYGVLCLAGSLALLAGCARKNYKRDADERVYRFVDGQWKPEFGPQANYRITGAPPSPQDIDADQVERIKQAVSDKGVLTIPQAAALAVARNRDYQLQKELLYTTALDMRLMRHAYENQWFGGGTASYADDGTGTRMVVEPNLGFNRLLATGALVGVRVGARWANILTGLGNSGWSGVFGASVIQPLLRGSDPRIVREPLTQAERNVLYQIRTLCRSRKALVVFAVTQYYETLEVLDTARNAEAHVNSLAALENSVRSLVEAARLPKEELDRVRQEVLRARDAEILARREYERLLDSLKFTLGVAPTLEVDLDPMAFEALEISGIPYPDVSLSEAVETALFRRLDLTNNADMVLDAQRGVYVAADALRPGLNVFGDLRTETNGDRSGTAGVGLDLPLDRVAEQDSYARALVMMNQRRREYEQTADTIRLEVREAHRKLLETAQRYEVLSEGARLAQRRADDTSELLRYVRVSSRRVLSALDDLYDARNEAADALTDYAIATLNFYLATEVLQVRSDGTWEVQVAAMLAARSEAPVGE